MSQLKEILVKERERSTMEQCTVIHLFREGTFYRAYEWSAWLCLRYFTELKVTHRLLKSGEDIVFVGFPLTSFDRYTPHGALVSSSGDKSVEITLPGEAFAPGVDCLLLEKVDSPFSRICNSGGENTSICNAKQKRYLGFNKTR